MSETSNQIEFITEKVKLLLAQNEQLKSEKLSLTEKNNQLNNQIDQSAKKLNQLEQSIATLTTENEKLKTVEAPITESTDVTVSQKELDKMIEEINECMALLDI